MGRIFVWVLFVVLMTQSMVAMLPNFNAVNYKPARNHGVLYDRKYVYKNLYIIRYEAIGLYGIMLTHLQ